MVYDPYATGSVMSKNFGEERFTARLTNLHMPRDLLFALEPLLSVPGTLVPEALVVSFAAAYVHVVYMCRQGVTRLERQSAGLPAAFVRAATAVVAWRRNRSQRFINLFAVSRLGGQ